MEPLKSFTGFLEPDVITEKKDMVDDNNNSDSDSTEKLVQNVEIVEELIENEDIFEDCVEEL